MTAITANDLKKKGVSVLDPILKDEEEVVITVRGQSRYVVMEMDAYNHFRECELEAALLETKREMDAYNHFRECELEAALLETKRDLSEGRHVSENVADHIRRITDEL